MEKSLEDQVLAGEAIDDMVRNSAGWKQVSVILQEMRSEAFTEWSNLPLTATPQDAMACRAKDKVLTEFIERVHGTVSAGQEARETLLSRRDDIERDEAFRGSLGSTQKDIEDLLKPLSPKA